MDRDKACRIVFDYLRLRHAPEKANAIFILGGSTLGPPEWAAELYHEHWVPVLAFIDIGGTFGPKGNVSTVELYHAKLLELGVPGGAMLWSAMTRNTLEEARMAMPFLMARGVDPATVLLVSRPVHQRRAWATFQKQWPAIKFVSCPANEPFDPEETDRLIAELERLERYSRAGDLLPQAIPEDVQAARALLASAT